MLESLISSRTRIRLLLKFFLNSEVRSYLRELESEFGTSSNAIRVELNRMERAGLLESMVEGNRRYYRANRRHPLFGDIQRIIRKYIGLDQITEQIIRRLGNVEEVYLTGDFARGKDAPTIDIAILGDIRVEYFLQLVAKAEKLIRRKIRYVLYTPEEVDAFRSYLSKETALLIWKREQTS